MKLSFDEDLVESAVARCAASPPRGVPALQIARFHRAREKLYSILDPDDRNAAFFKLHLEWFREWNLEALLTRPLDAFPEIAKGVTRLAFRKARGKKDEGAELYVNASGDRTGVISLCPERVAQGGSLAAFLWHELMHLRDMVDPAFGYRPELSLSGTTQSQHGLARERYRLLWDVSIDGRLCGAGKPIVGSREQRWAEFTKVFAFWPEAKRQEVFDAVWTARQPTHGGFEEWVCDPRQLGSATGPQPGAPCPLCRFPTFTWTDAILSDAQAAAIRIEFPDWTPRQGICGRCYAVYRSMTSTVALVV